jgi:hypothetical protein
MIIDHQMSSFAPSSQIMDFPQMVFGGGPRPWPLEATVAIQATAGIDTNFIQATISNNYPKYNG